MSTDHRQAAQQHATRLLETLKSLPASEARDAIVAECESLVVAIGAFHMEAIRFRMFNVDRLLAKMSPAPDEARQLFADTRQELEAAGFHTRSHQAPTSRA
jgi:hypothetical protein